MAFFRNFTFNLTPNADIELEEIEEGSGPVLTSSNIPASTTISHPLSAFPSNSAFTFNLTKNPDIEIPDFSLATSDIPLGSDQDAQTNQVPITNPLMPGDCSMTGPDSPHPESHAVEQHQDTQTTQAPIANPLMPSDFTMSGPDNPHSLPPNSLLANTSKDLPTPHPQSHALEQPQTKIQFVPMSVRKRSHQERERTEKVRVVEQKSRLPREKAVQMSKLIEQKYENEFQDRATKFVDKMVEEFEIRKRELENQYGEAKERAGEADERAMKAAQKANDALKQANLVEDHARHAIEKAEMMERRYLEMMSRENRSSEPVEVEKAADALKRASVVEEQARQAIEKAQMMESRYLEMMSRENRSSEPAEVEKAADALKRAGVVEEQARQAMEKAQMMERRYLEMMSPENRNSERIEVESALKRATAVEEQAQQAIEKAQVMERRFLEIMSQGKRNHEQMDEDAVGSIVPDPMDYTTIQERNETHDDDDDDNDIDIYGMVMSDDRGNTPGPLSKDKGRDTGDNGWEDDEPWEESVGPKVPSSYDDDMTTEEKAPNGRTEIPDELSLQPDVPPPQNFHPRRKNPTFESQIHSKVHFNEDPMRASNSSWAQPQLQLQLQSPPPLQPPMASDSVWAQPQHQPQLQSQPQPQPLRQGRPRQASWKAGIVGLYGASAPAMDPISEAEIIGEKKGRAPRMFRQPPKRKSDAVKAAKQTALRKCVNELMGIEKDADLETFVGATNKQVKCHEAGTIRDPVLRPMRPYLLKHVAVTWNESLCNQFVDHYQAELNVIFTEDQRDEVMMMFDERLERMSRTWQRYQKERGEDKDPEANRLKMERAKRTRQNSRRNGLFKDRLAISAGNMHGRDGSIDPEWKASYDMVLNLGPSGMSSDESEEEDGRMTYVVKARCWRSQAVNKRLKIIDRDRINTNSLGGAPSGNPPRKRKRVIRPTLSSRDPVIGCPKNYYSERWVSNLPNRGVSELNEKQHHDLLFLPGEESD